mmetsp:Transcript_23389/g.38462  ORF Transcript_23389/g.38462 Transcript_23389/m.38462 type:complete len:284 (+) Transcript_23389:67-918(+)
MAPGALLSFAATHAIVSSNRLSRSPLHSFEKSFCGRSREINGRRAICIGFRPLNPNFQFVYSTLENLPFFSVVSQSLSRPSSVLQSSSRVVQTSSGSNDIVDNALRTIDEWWHFVRDIKTGARPPPYEGKTILDVFDYVSREGGTYLSKIDIPNDTVLYCIFAAAVLIYFPFLFAALGRLQAGVDERAPRAAFPRLPPYAQRATWAHQNAVETFAPFAIAAAIAVSKGDHSTFTSWSAIFFVGARTVFPLAYIFNIPKLRSFAFGIGQLSMYALYLHLLGLIR